MADSVDLGFRSNIQDGVCDGCGAAEVRVFVDGGEFCSMGCAKAAQDSPRPEREVRVGKGKEKK